MGKVKREKVTQKQKEGFGEGLNKGQRNGYRGEGKSTKAILFEKKNKATTKPNLLHGNLK